MAYATQEEKKTALSLGYTITETTRNGTSFSRGDRQVWSIQNGWQTADLIGFVYCNHKKYSDLSDALNRIFEDRIL